MDGLEDFIENGIEFIKNHIPSNDGSNDVGDRLSDDCSENTMLITYFLPIIHQ